MGFLKRLFTSKPTFEDRVWQTRELALEDLVRQVAADQRDGAVDCLVVYHFPDTEERLGSKLGPNNQVLSRPGSDVLANLRSRAGSAVAVLASDEIPEEVKRGRDSRRRTSGERPCHVHLAEHFPMPYRDDHVLNLGSILPSSSKFFCYVGLDESWLAANLGAEVRPLLDQLGMSDDEPLVHSMIGSALRSAQEQLANKQRGIEHQAASGDEWMALNASG